MHWKEGPLDSRPRPRRRREILRGPNWVHSLDEHDKLMGYQNSTLPIAVYRCLDTCSPKVMCAKVWVSNSDPKLIGHFYLDNIYENKTIASRLRVDKGMETGVMATMHAYCRQGHGDMDPAETVIFGPSTSNLVKTPLNLMLTMLSLHLNINAYR